jgi:hypothetical protein
MAHSLFSKDSNGLHYHTWRNVISRECLAEKENFNPENNPEKIPSVPTTRYQDQNFIQCVQPLQTFWPRTLGGERKEITEPDAGEPYTKKPLPHGLRGVVREAIKRNLKVKAVGSGHSFSDVATTSDFLVVTDYLNQVLLRKGLPFEPALEGPNIRHYPFLKEILRDKGGYAAFINSLKSDNPKGKSRHFYGQLEEKPQLVEIEAGIKIETLNRKLWDMGFSLYNMGTYQGQSFIGAASTATHGSGHKLPPLHDMIKSMVLVADSGLVFRVEPTVGITQPYFKLSHENFKTMVKVRRTMDVDISLDDKEEESKLVASIADKFITLTTNSRISQSREDHVDFLIQDDDWFASALVNIGTFGIVYSVIIEVIPRYFLLETVEFTTWGNLRGRLIEQNKYLDPKYLDPATKRTDEKDYSELFERKKFVARFPVNKRLPCPCSEKKEQSKLKPGGSKSTGTDISSGLSKKHEEADCCEEYKDGKPIPETGNDHGNETVVTAGSRGGSGPVPVPAMGKLTRKEKYWGICVKDIRQTTIEIHPHKYPGSGKGDHICRIIRQYRVKESELTRKWGLNVKGRTAGAKNPTVLDQLNSITEIVSHDNPGDWYNRSVLLTAVAILRPVSGTIGDGLNLFIHSRKRTEDVIKRAPVEPDCNERFLARNYTTQELPLFSGCGVELALRTTESPVNHTLPAYVDAVDRVLKMAQEHWDLGKYMQTSPVALRMVKASNAYLSMQQNEHNQPACMIELLSLADTVGCKELFYRYQRALFKYGGRPHWGLDFSTITGNNGLLETMYPKFNEWKTAYDAFNHNGTFNNRFTDRMGL